MVWVATALFAWWIAATILRQIRRDDDIVALRGMERFSLIPRWLFFAPHPASSDYRLLFRDRYARGQFSLYREASFGPRLSWVHAVWNPRKRNQKVLSDAVRSLVRAASRMPEAGFKTTLPYLAILNYVSSLPRTTASEAVQFAIVETYGHFPVRSPRLVMQSEIHGLERLARHDRHAAAQYRIAG